MLKVMNYIVDWQRDFFEGRAFLNRSRFAKWRGDQHARVDGEPRDERSSSRRRAVCSRSSSSPPASRRPPAKTYRPAASRRRSRAGRRGRPKHPLTGQASWNILKEGGYNRPPHGGEVPRQLGVLSARMRKRDDLNDRSADEPYAGQRPRCATTTSGFGRRLRPRPAKDEAENLPLFMEQAAEAFAASHWSSHRHRRRQRRSHVSGAQELARRTRSCVPAPPLAARIADALRTGYLARERRSRVLSGRSAVQARAFPARRADPRRRVRHSHGFQGRALRGVRLQRVHRLSRTLFNVRSRISTRSRRIGAR